MSNNNGGLRTCMRCASHELRVREPWEHFSTCLPVSERGAYYARLPTHLQRDIDRNAQRAIDVRARLRDAPDGERLISELSRSLALLRSRYHPKQRSFEKRTPSQPQFGNGADGDADTAPHSRGKQAGSVAIRSYTRFSRS